MNPWFPVDEDELAYNCRCFPIEVLSRDSAIMMELTLEDIIKSAGPETLITEKPEEKETPEEARKRARKPPAEGPCKRCGQNKPLNRLLLCYPCWVKSELEKGGWREGQPHPGGCGCDVDCRFDKKGADN